jgi:hypothetical protein
VGGVVDGPSTKSGLAVRGVALHESDQDGSAVEGSGALRRLRLRYPATCSVCGISLAPGTEAFWDREAKAATCLSCGPTAMPCDAGVAGASAAAEGGRRLKQRVTRARRRYGDLAAAVARGGRRR